MSIKGLRQTAKHIPLLVAVVMTIPFALQAQVSESSGQPGSRYQMSETQDITERLDAGYWDMSGAVADAPVQLPERVLGELLRLAALAVTPTPPARTILTVTAASRSYITPPPDTSSLTDALAASPWPAELWSKVTAIAMCESKLNANAVGDNGRALGLMQVRSDYHGEKLKKHDPFTYEGSLALAYEIYVEARYSFSPWTCA